MTYIPEAFDFETVDTNAVGWCTCVGSDTSKYPVEHGNCFSLKADDRQIKIVNFYHENLEHLLKERIVTWPVKVTILSGKAGVINDSRIPDNFYNVRFCEVCCPDNLLPMPQRLKKHREIAGGKTSFKLCKGENGEPDMVIQSSNIQASERKLKGTWTYDN